MSQNDGEDDATSIGFLVGSSSGTATDQESVDDFSPEWCQKLLNDSSYEHANIATRKLGALGPASNSLMAKTLFTDNTFRAIKLLYKPPNSDPSARRIGGELLALISLGDEMCSHVHTLHGGINTTIIDEIGGELAGREVKDYLMAVNFNVNLRKAVRTPGIILCRAWMERKPEGRKVWVKCSIEQDGKTCIEGENLYLRIDMKGKL